jgi:hypothetical protein
MKTLEKMVGVNTADFANLLPALTSASTRMLKEYTQGTHPKLKMLDSLIALSVVTFVVQIVYANVIVFNKDPFNSYLAGIFCSLGQSALAGKDLSTPH